MYPGMNHATIAISTIAVRYICSCSLPIGATAS